MAKLKDIAIITRKQDGKQRKSNMLTKAIAKVVAFSDMTKKQKKHLKQK